MTRKIPKILAINPGTRYVGIVIFQGLELVEWRVKVIGEKWSKEKQRKILALVRRFDEQYKPNVLAMKKLHRSRSSDNLNCLASRIKQECRRNGLRVYQYTIKELEAFFLGKGRTNKNKLAQVLASQYQFLLPEFQKEQENKNPYYFRMFEAVALGAACAHKLS
jgi:Holliday junction resolvasome RuvABC endonuclease subunit